MAEKSGLAPCFYIACAPKSNHYDVKECLMAHKKIERKKELDRRRHRRAQRAKERIREAKAAAKSK